MERFRLLIYLLLLLFFLSLPWYAHCVVVLTSKKAFSPKGPLKSSKLYDRLTNMDTFRHYASDEGAIKLLQDAHTEVLDRLHKKNYHGENPEGEFLRNKMNENPEVLKDLITLKAIHLLQIVRHAESKQGDPLKDLQKFAEELGATHEHPPESSSPYDDVIITAGGTNIFLRGELLWLVLIYRMQGELFTHETIPLYTWDKLISKSSNERYDILDSMCGVVKVPRKTHSKNNNKYLPRYKRKYKPTKTGYNGFYCNLMERYFIVLDKAYQLLLRELHKKGALLESNAEGRYNDLRLQAMFCKPSADKTKHKHCSFEDSELQNEENEEERLSLRTAWHYVDAVGLNSTALWELEKDANANSNFLEIFFWQDYRKLDAWKKGYQNELKRCKTKTKKKKKKIDEDCMLKNLFFAVMEESPGGKESIRKMVEEALEKHVGQNPMRAFQGAKSEEYRSFFESHPLILPYILLYNLLSLHESPVKAYRKQLEHIERTPALYKLMRGSKWKPNTIVKLATALQNLFTSEAKRKELLDGLVAFVSNKVKGEVYSSVEFVVHTVAMLQVNQKAYFYKDSRGREAIGIGGSMANADGKIASWSNDGLSPHIMNQVKHNHALTNKDLAGVRYYKMPTPKTQKWADELSKVVSEDLDTWLQLPETINMQFDKNFKNHVIEVVKDSKRNLDELKETAIFLGNVEEDTRDEALGFRLLSTLRGFWRGLLRKGPLKREHAVWFAVTLDANKIMSVVDTVYKYYKTIEGQGGGTLIFDTFDAYVKKLQEEKCKPRSHPITVPSTTLLQELDPNYGYMTEKERKEEFQRSMQCTSLASVWKLIAAFSLHNKIGGGDLKTMDSRLSSSGFIKNINDPLFVNSLKVIFKADVSLEFLDNMLPKKMKRQLKTMSYGKATWFTYAMKLASILLQKMNLRYLSMALSVQAPYMGNMVNDWQKLRTESKIKELTAYVTFGTVAIYAYVRYMDMVQYNAATGMPPTTNEVTEAAKECGFGAKNCTPGVPSPVSPTPNLPADTMTSQAVALSDLLSTGLFGLLGGIFWQALAVKMSFDVIKSQFKIVERVCMGLKNLLKIGIRWIKNSKIMKNIVGFFKKKNTEKAKIEDAARAAASSGHKEAAPAAGGKKPELESHLMGGSVKDDTATIESMAPPG